MIFFLEKCCHVLDILLISYVNLIFLIDLNRQFLLAMAMQCINKNMRTTHRIIMDTYKVHFFWAHRDTYVQSIRRQNMRTT